MDKPTLEHLIRILPDDASEISIPRHDSNEVLFNSDAITKDTAKILGAIPAQKGTYRGTKRRWRLTVHSLSGGGTPVLIESLPLAD